MSLYQQNKIKATKGREVSTKSQVAGAGGEGGTEKLPRGQQHGGPLLDILADAEPVVEAHSLVVSVYVYCEGFL